MRDGRAAIAAAALAVLPVFPAAAEPVTLACRNRSDASVGATLVLDVAAGRLVEASGSGPTILFQDRNLPLTPARARSPGPRPITATASTAKPWTSSSALRGRNSVRPDATPPADPELIRGAKGFLERELLLPGAKYSETADQVSLTSAMNFNEARACPSFSKLYRDMAALLG